MTKFRMLVNMSGADTVVEKSAATVGDAMSRVRNENPDRSVILVRVLA